MYSSFLPTYSPASFTDLCATWQHPHNYVELQQVVNSGVE